ncbi:MAG: RimK family alpha-L-glutamate ligase [Deltaproteobacteria bacterium]|nr:RimK family alpha-L-glutamate ligase [Deltaproteobacteria bacterium]
MNIGIITVRDLDYHPNGRLSQSAAEKGHRAVLIHPYEVWPKIGEEGLGYEGRPDLRSMDVIMPRQGATIGESSLTLLHHLSHMGIPLVNDFDAVRITRSQIMTLQALAIEKIPVPDTLFVNSRKGFFKAIPLTGGYPVVVKQVSGRQGAGIQLVENRNQADAMLAKDIDLRTGILLQRFIPTVGRQDLRIFVVGGRAAGAMEIQPENGDFRANFHLTRKSRPRKVTPMLEKIALDAARVTGLDIAGIDLIVDRHDDIYVIEVNYSPGFKGLEKATGLDIAGCMIDCAIAKAKCKGRKVEG